ncbi:MAG: hypothetical protein JXB32_06480 [Deltaproteobacteria bacterium]|nr:hypothetical protein [Deltaproteobacteria bacterium]
MNGIHARGRLGALLLLLAGACGPAAGATPTNPRQPADAPPPDDATDPAPGPHDDLAPRTARPDGEWSIRVVAVELERQPDGERYPNWVRESYRLESDGVLDYSAYFGGMPIEMNHMDGIEWEAGATGQAVFDAVLAVLDDPARFAELTPVPDDGPEPTCLRPCYRIGLSRADGDHTFVLGDRETPALAELETAFAALIAAFESATGRPLSPGDLPQR